MQKIGSTKYLQLPASNDIGKPSPLAMLAATCQRIGAPSPARATMRRRSSTPVASPVAEPTPVVVKTEVRSPSPAPVRELPAPKTVVAEREVCGATIMAKIHPTSLQVKVPSPDYRLPLTPPTTPTSSIETSSSPPPRVPSIPVAVPSTSPHVAYSYMSDHPAAVSEYPCHLGLPLHHQPVLHAPSLRYSPYTVVVPSSHPSHVHEMSPFVGYAGQVCCPPHTPVAPPCTTMPMAALPPVYYQSPYVLPAAATGAPLVAAPFQFGTYLHHELPVTTASSHYGKIRARPAHAKSPSTTERRSTAYDITRLLKKHEIDEDIDVVSV